MSGPQQRLALTVVGGFLGAGKTTLLNGWLRALPADSRIAVLVNDFGAVNIDAELVAARTADTIALTNGCVCCSIGGDLTAALIRVLDEVPVFDAVIVEASGVSDPWKIAQLGLADPGVALENIVVVLDAVTVLSHAADPRLAATLQRQVACADLLVINKPGIAGAAQVASVRAWVRSLVPGTPVLESADGTLAPLQADRSHAAHAARAARAQCCDHAHAEEHARTFDSFVLRPGGLFSAAALRNRLRAVPPGLLRLKGFLPTDEMALTEVQFAGRHGLLRPASESATSGVLVAIGLRGDLSPRTLESWLLGAALAGA